MGGAPHGRGNRSNDNDSTNLMNSKTFLSLYLRLLLRDCRIPRQQQRKPKHTSLAPNHSLISGELTCMGDPAIITQSLMQLYDSIPFHGFCQRSSQLA
jgi:hypothetical protein